jgi:hypothetical protein
VLEKIEVVVGDLLCPVPVLSSKKSDVEGYMSASSTLTIPASTSVQGCVSVGCHEIHEGTEMSLTSLPKSFFGPIANLNDSCSVNLNGACDNFVTCIPSPDLSTPATEKSSGDSGKVGVTQLTGTPLCRSSRLLNNISADGISTEDEDTMQKSMKQTAWKNLDGALDQEKAAARSPSISIGLSHNPLCLDALPDVRCASSLNKLGFSLGSSALETSLAIEALKNIDIDRSKVTPKKAFSKHSHQNQVNPFDESEDKDAETDGALLALLVQEVSKVYFDDEALNTKICDLMASSRKARTSKKRAKNIKNTCFPNERSILE